MKRGQYILFALICFCFIGWGITQDIQIAKLKQHHSIKYEKYSYPYDCMMEAELNYLETKVALTREVQAYIDKVAPISNIRGYAIVEECTKYGVDICFVLAQGQLESCFGTIGLGSKFNNVFNVAVHDKVKGKKDMNKNYIYKHPNESIEPYLKLLIKNYLVDKLESDLMDNYVDVNGLRYATDENYEIKLKSKYNSIIEETNISNLQLQLRNYAIKCDRIWKY